VSQLERLVVAAHDNSSTLVRLQAQVEKLRAGIDATYLHLNAVKQLQVVVDTSDGLLLRRGKAIVGRALKAPELGSRFVVVSDSFLSTFDWILADIVPEDKEPPETRSTPQTSQDTNDPKAGLDWVTVQEGQQRLSQRETAAQFVTWLTRGRDFFHISGKPGAGKSTLMKFLFKNERTHKCLHSWAKKSLILACMLSPITTDWDTRLAKTSPRQLKTD
jgi:hypothetical protein